MARESKSVFKMSGYSYPGTSPIKGKKKVAAQAAASDAHSSAMDNISEAFESDKKSTNLLEGQNTTYGEMPSPVSKRAPLKQQPVGSFSTQQKLEGNLVVNQELMNKEVSAPKKSFGESFKGAMASEMGQAAGKALIEGGVELAVGAMSRGKKEPVKRGGSTNAFSQVKIGKK